jgi:soluble lytic murein transglycosylase-like protein
MKKFCICAVIIVLAFSALPFISDMISEASVVKFKQMLDTELMAKAEKSYREKYGPEPDMSDVVRTLNEARIYNKIESEAGPVVAFVIVQACKKHGVAFEEAASLAYTENHKWDPRAVSRKGAKGLFQLMPATYKDEGGKDPFDVAENADIGIGYYAKMLRWFDGNRKLAVNAYNAGHKTVRKFNGNVPYKETKDHYARYLKKKIELLKLVQS